MWRAPLPAGPKRWHIMTTDATQIGRCVANDRPEALRIAAARFGVPQSKVRAVAGGRA